MEQLILGGMILYVMGCFIGFEVLKDWRIRNIEGAFDLYDLYTLRFLSLFSWIAVISISIEEKYYKNERLINKTNQQ